MMVEEGDPIPVAIAAAAVTSDSVHHAATDRSSLKRYAWLSVAAACLTIALKGGAWVETGSVGLLSDALESLVNLAAALFALVTLAVAARPPDQEHAFGHDKAEYFAGGFEGGLIIVAAVTIAIAAINRIGNPRAIEDIEIGLLLAGIASLVNLAVGRLLLRVGRRERSMALEADGRHLMTDVWTSVGVFLGLGGVALTGWDLLDPLIGLAVALHIVISGLRLLYRSVQGLMDHAVPDDQLLAITTILDRPAPDGIEYHALRTRVAGGRSFISFHLLVPGAWTVQQAHDFADGIEQEIREALPEGAAILSHIEPVEDPMSWKDEKL